VAFGGRMQVGKTTAARHLEERHGFVRMALADPIKEIARDMGWDGAKDARGRRLLQEVGDVGRRYDPAVWLDRLAARIEAAGDRRVVVDDVRLGPEVERLRALGFRLARVDRPAAAGAGALGPGSPQRDHATETGLEGAAFDRVIDNSGTFEELYARLDGWLEELEGAGGGLRETERPHPETGPSALGQEETQA
jgi:hypothetical protein